MERTNGALIELRKHEKIRERSKPKKTKEKNAEKFERIIQKYPNLLESIDLKVHNNNAQYNDFLIEIREVPASIQEKKSFLLQLYKESSYRKSRNTTKSNMQNESNIGSFAFYHLKHVSLIKCEI
jgi:hypothetical protein